MNLAFPALFILLLVLPGIILRYTYARGPWRWESPTSITNLSDEIAYSVAFAVGLHLLWMASTPISRLPCGDGARPVDRIRLSAHIPPPNPFHDNAPPSRTMRINALAAAAAFLIAMPAAAQETATQPADVPTAAAPRVNDGLTGTRVRVTAPNYLPEVLQGTVTSYRQDGLSVASEATGDTVLLPLRAISRLDKYAGGSRGSTAWYRGRWGAFLGAGLGLVAAPLTARLTDREMGESAMIGGAIGLGTGFALGAAMGAGAPRERWTWTMQPWGYDPTLRP